MEGRVEEGERGGSRGEGAGGAGAGGAGGGELTNPFGGRVGKL